MSPGVEKGVRIATPAQERFEFGAFIVGVFEPMTGESIVRALAPERFGWRCAPDAWASETIVLIRCVQSDGAALTEVQTRSALDLLGRPAGVKFIELNHLVEASLVPNDPSWSQQWHYRAMGLPAAWDVTTGSSDVVVAVIDSGISAHPDLAANLVPGIDLISDVANAHDGDARDDDATDVMGPVDPRTGGSSWHGTHVAGTIAAASNNGVGVAGVSWNAKVLPVRVLGKTGGSTIDIAAGINWAAGGSVPGTRINTNVARVLNLSLGGDGPPSQAYQTVIDAAVARGAIVVVAAGNEDADTTNKRPCNQSNVICVAGTDLRGKATGYTNYGDAVTVSAPGGATDRDDDGDGKPDGVLSTIGGGAYARMQGTSMASPHVAGLVALLKSVRPSLTHGQARDALVASATPVSNCMTACGAGNVDAARALASVSQQMQTSGRLSVSASSVVLTSDETSVPVRVSNVGNAPLSINFHGPSGLVANVRWNPVSIPLPLGAGQSATIDVSWVGSFASDVDVPMTFKSEAGEAELLIRVRRPRVMPKTYVAAFVFENGEWEQVKSVWAKSDGTYDLREVPRGTYYVAAFSDDDGDGVFEEDEGVGMWPSVNDPEPLTLKGDDIYSDVNFTVAPESRGSTVIGLECGSNAQCEFGDFCSTWTGGYCTRRCTEGSCGSGAECVTFSEGERFCLQRCDNPGNGRGTCRQDYACTPTDEGTGVCIPAP